MLLNGENNGTMMLCLVVNCHSECNVFSRSHCIFPPWDRDALVPEPTIWILFEITQDGLPHHYHMSSNNQQMIHSHHDPRDPPATAMMKKVAIFALSSLDWSIASPES